MFLEHNAFKLGWGCEEAVCDATLFGWEASHTLPGAVAIYVGAGLDDEEEFDHLTLGGFGSGIQWDGSNGGFVP